MIRVLDIETTGMERGEGAEVVELGWWDMDMTVLLPMPLVRTDCHGVSMYRPERPCPPEVRAVHHIHPAEYEQAPVFCIDALVGELATAGVTYLAAHNAEYEAQFIESELPWLCTYKAALRLWPHAPHHGNQSLMYWLGLDTELDEGRRHPPHRALPDAYVTAHILGRLLREATVEQIAQWSTEPRLLPACPIGKEKGKPWPEVDHGFMVWMLRQPDMEADYRWNAQRELDRRRTARLAGDA